MRRILLFILPILIIVSLALVVFGIIQVSFEKDRLMDDLHRRTMHMAESMELSVKNIIQTGDVKSAQYLVQKFEGRQRIQGCAIYNSKGNIIAITGRFHHWKNHHAINLAPGDIRPYAETGKYDESPIFSFFLPVTDNQGNVLGAVEILHETTYVSSRVGLLWQRLSITLMAMLVSIFAIVFFVQRQLFFLPLQRLTEWFRLFQRGETDKLHTINARGELAQFASEVEQLALSLRVARKSISEQATVKFKSDELWTEEKLKNLIHAKLGENTLFVVSNRAPYIHTRDQAGNVKCVRPAGGVVTALHPVLSACGGTWIAHGSGNADMQFVNSKDKLGVPPNDNRYILKRVWLTKEEEEGYYYGFANEGLWPHCLNTYTRPVFREKDWLMYQKVNRKFAESILEELPAHNPFIFIQDYHFTLLGKYIKEKRPDATIALFWHIPWPNPEAFAICPYQEEILEGLLGCDLLGFQVQSHCNNFLDTANRLLESRVDAEKYSVVRFGKETLIRPFPISIDSSASNQPFSAEILRTIKELRTEFDLDGKIVALGVDRIDYTKGIIERILAIDRFLEKYPEYKKRFVFIQIGSPSRIHIKRYRELNSEIDELVDNVNWKHADGLWKPIIYHKRHFNPEEIEPYYALADLCIISSLHDGMNLVAKEYIAAKKGSAGSLVLSQFTGAAKELTDAVLINPYSIEEFSDSIKYAIEIPEDEKEARMKHMQEQIMNNNVFRWAADIVTELTALKKT
jgi:trehalose-6-phosphate synthase